MSLFLDEKGLLVRVFVILSRLCKNEPDGLLFEVWCPVAGSETVRYFRHVYLQHFMFTVYTGNAGESVG